jgi:hypothetical protein
VAMQFFDILAVCGIVVMGVDKHEIDREYAYLDERRFGDGGRGSGGYEELWIYYLTFTCYGFWLEA